MFLEKTWCTIHHRRMIDLYEKNVFYDSDCLVCFLAVGQCGILQQMFSKVIVPKVVSNEILKPFKTPPHIKANMNKLIGMDFVEVREMIVGSRVHNKYIEIKNNHQYMGDGEAAVLALTYENGGVIASNNLSDIRVFAEDNDLNFITTAFILAKAYEKGIKSRSELDMIWSDMLNEKRERSLPRGVKSFTEYYGGKYVMDNLYMKLE